MSKRFLVAYFSYSSPHEIDHHIHETSTTTLSIKLYL